MCRYLFNTWPVESVDNDDTMRLTVATDRSINLTTKCTSRAVLAVDAASQTISIVQGAAGASANISFSVTPGDDQTIFATTTPVSCGAGCKEVTALEVSKDSQLYNCTVMSATQ
ncbi:hypothetical protein BN1723_000446, partial [Verticillium longisporum]